MKQCSILGCPHSVFSNGKCKKHYRFERKIPTIPKYVSKYNSQREMFIYIWNTREHISAISGRKLDFVVGSTQWACCFMHVLEKKNYPHFLLNPDNIILGHPEEHRLEHFGTSDQIREYEKQYNACFGVLDDLKEELKNQYKIL